MEGKKNKGAIIYLTIIILLVVALAFVAGYSFNLTKEKEISKTDIKVDEKVETIKKYTTKELIEILLKKYPEAEIESGTAYYDSDDEGIYYAYSNDEVNINNKYVLKGTVKCVAPIYKQTGAEVALKEDGKLYYRASGFVEFELSQENIIEIVDNIKEITEEELMSKGNDYLYLTNDGKLIELDGTVYDDLTK